MAFFTLHTDREMCSQEEFCLCHSKCEVVIVCHILSFVHPRVCLVKLPLLACVFGLTIKKVKDVVFSMYFKHSTIISIKSVYGFVGVSP